MKMSFGFQTAKAARPGKTLPINRNERMWCIRVSFEAYLCHVAERSMISKTHRTLPLATAEGSNRKLIRSQLGKCFQCSVARVINSELWIDKPIYSNCAHEKRLKSTLKKPFFCMIINEEIDFLFLVLSGHLNCIFRPDLVNLAF